jgi:hypothetical protein
MARHMKRWQRGRRAPETAWGSACAARRDFAAIGSLYTLCAPAAGPRGVSDRTWRDLSLDDVFAKLDRCVTMIGKQTLYLRMRLANDSPSETARFDRTIRAFSDDPKLRDQFREAVGTLDGDASSLLYGEPPPLPRAAALFPFATCATFLAAAVSVVWPIALLVFVGLIIGNIAIRLHLHQVMSAHADALATIAKLVAAAERASSIESHPHALRADFENLRAALAVVAPWRKSLTWATLESPSLNELLASVIAYLNCFFLLDVNAYVGSLSLLRQATPALRQIFETVGDLDAARSIASFRAGAKSWSVPAIGRRGGPVVLTSMVHPLIDAAVPNDVSLTDRGWLVLGSNMSGKSTCLKSIALQAILAQSIATTTCEGYAAPPLLVRTLIHVEDETLYHGRRGAAEGGTQDDLEHEKSHFYVEAESVRDMLVEEADDMDRLCVVDELFRGTNTHDRVAAGAAVLRGLHRRGVFVVAATHDAELMDLVEAELDPHYFTERIEDGRLVFDYVLHAGRAAPRNALAVLELVGCPEDVLADARVYLPGA